MRKLLILVLVFWLSGLVFADTIGVYYQEDVRWHWRPAANAASYFVEILFDGDKDWQVYIADIPPDTATDAAGLDWVEVTVTVSQSTIYQIRAAAQNADKTVTRYSLISDPVKIDLGLSQPTPVDAPDAVEQSP